MDFGAIQEQYLGVQENFHGLGRDRLKSIRSALRGFGGWLNGPLGDVSERDMRGWLEHLAETRKASTVKQHRKVLKPFFRWAEQEGYHPGLDWDDIPSPKVPRDKPRPYKPSEVQALFADIDATWPREDREWYLDRFRGGLAHFRRVEGHTMNLQLRAIVHVALAAGPRRAELRAMSVDDLHWENEYVVINHPAKGGVDRIAPHTDDSRQAVRDWLEWRQHLFLSANNPGVAQHDDPWISASRYNNTPGGWLHPMGEQRWETILHLNGNNWGMHRLRHTCGTDWYKAGMDIGFLQILMGHTNIAQTLAYAELDGADVIGMAARLEGRLRQRRYGIGPLEPDLVAA